MPVTFTKQSRLFQHDFPKQLRTSPGSRRAWRAPDCILDVLAIYRVTLESPSPCIPARSKSRSCCKGPRPSSAGLHSGSSPCHDGCCTALDGNERTNERTGRPGRPGNPAAINPSPVRTGGAFPQQMPAPALSFRHQTDQSPTPGPPFPITCSTQPASDNGARDAGNNR